MDKKSKTISVTENGTDSAQCNGISMISMGKLEDCTAVKSSKFITVRYSSVLTEHKPCIVIYSMIIQNTVFHPKNN